MIECTDKVSILLKTYNHKKYIARSLNSALMQKTDFNFTVWVADDCSTDGTSEIIQDIIANNKNKRATINHVLPPKNLGIKNKEVHGDSILRSAELKNQYVAFCCGDDYWISDKKLQDQHDILKNNKESISVGDSFISLFSDGLYLNQHKNEILKKHKALLSPRNPVSQEGTLMFKNIIDWDYFPDILHDDDGYTKVFNNYGDIIFREIATVLYDRTTQGFCMTEVIPIEGVSEKLDYLMYLLVRIIHYLRTNENLLFEKDHEFILTKLNKDWKITEYYFIDDRILELVEQYKIKRSTDNVPHYTTNMIFESRPKYKIVP